MCSKLSILLPQTPEDCHDAWKSLLLAFLKSILLFFPVYSFLEQCVSHPELLMMNCLDWLKIIPVYDGVAIISTIRNHPNNFTSQYFPSSCHTEQQLLLMLNTSSASSQLSRGHPTVHQTAKLWWSPTKVFKCIVL